MAAPSEDSDDDKVICIKPPIIVKDLADRMGVKVYVLIKAVSFDERSVGYAHEPDAA